MPTTATNNNLEPHLLQGVPVVTEVLGRLHIPHVKLEDTLQKHKSTKAESMSAQLYTALYTRPKHGISSTRTLDMGLPPFFLNVGYAPSFLAISLDVVTAAKYLQSIRHHHTGTVSNHKHTHSSNAT